MKKTIISLFCLCIGFAATAQDQVGTRVENSPRLTRNGYKYLPVKGDYAIGIEATPFLEYLGNSFNNTSGNQAPLFNGTDNTIYGKYFLENNRAVRAKLRLNIGNNTYKGVVTNDEQVANNPLNVDATTIDTKKSGRTDIELRVGYEFRRGHGRIQGFWGGEVGVGFASGKDKFERGNPMTAANQAPTSWDFALENPAPVNYTSRATETKLGKTFSGTVAGFVGVEYFFAPQLSIGGEFNLGFTLASRGQDETTTEFWDAAASQVRTQTLRNNSWTETAPISGAKYNVEAGETELFTKTSGHLFLLFYF